jgi:ribose transport system permease protein
MKRRVLNFGLDRFSGVYLGVLFIIVFSLLGSQFFNLSTFHVVASTQSTAGIIALALLIPMVCDQFDLSVGANANLTGMLAVILQVQEHWPVLPAVLTSIGVGFLVGVVNGFIVVVLKVSSFIATLGVSSILGAVTIIFTNNITPPAPASPAWSSLTQVQLGGFQTVFFYLIALALLAWWLLEFTPAGRYLHAIGGNREAARLAGIRVNRWSWLALVLAGGVSGFAGILYTSLTGPSFTFGAGLLLPGFAAVFLGSTQISPGRFNVWGTLIAIFVLAIGVQGLQLLSGATWLSPMFNGIALITAVALAVTRGARRRKATRQASVRQSPSRDGSGPGTGAGQAADVGSGPGGATAVASRIQAGEPIASE